MMFEFEQRADLNLKPVHVSCKADPKLTMLKCSGGNAHVIFYKNRGMDSEDQPLTLRPYIVGSMVTWILKTSQSAHANETRYRDSLRVGRRGKGAIYFQISQERFNVHELAAFLEGQGHKLVVPTSEPKAAKGESISGSVEDIRSRFAAHKRTDG